MALLTLRIFSVGIIFLLAACHKPLNNPHPIDPHANIFYGSFSESPKTLDPAKSYTAGDILFISQIYEPVLEYHYLLRPYVLVPQTAQQMPQIRYWNNKHQLLPDNAPAQQIAYSTYDIRIKPGIFYQPHPAFATANKPLDPKKIHKLKDFPELGTRELVADDYVYEIKRLASPQVASPIFGFMRSHILGFDSFAQRLQPVFSQNVDHHFIDLRKYPLAGAQVIDKYTYRIYVKGKYQQFIYWLSMPFFSPIPWEADRFYSQPGMAEHNINLDWYPVGTGPYYLTINNPNQQMVLERNPNFRQELYPDEGEPGDKEAGYLQDAGKPLPFIDKFVFSLEKEVIPRWNKFLQGYYDQSAIGADSFDQAIQVDSEGNPHLTPQMNEKGIRLETTVGISLYYLGFNMLDKIVGGYDESAKKLRQAISIAIDFEEFISIFRNGRGLLAQGPIPPGVFGYLEGKESLDPYIFDWQKDRAKRKPIAYAKRLLAEAGYPQGRGSKSGRHLLINYDAVITSAPDNKDVFDWFRKQFAKLNIELNVRSTQYNRFQEKLRTGNIQTYMLGWVADYPDPENFLFLFYGPNGKVKYGGENSSNYNNPSYDSLFTMMRNLPNGPERQAVINQMIDILRQDAPVIWGFNPKDFLLIQQWVYPTKPTTMTQNTLKYLRINPALRAKLQTQWNQPIWWPLTILLLLLILLSVPWILSYWRKTYLPKR